MPYKEHILFTDPTETTLWRYMDFTKFVSLISKSTLFFPSAKMLQTFDPWEGSNFKISLANRLKWDLSFKSSNDKGSEYDFLKDKAETWKANYEYHCDIHFISCWHYNSVESAAMWRLYLKSNEGLCLQTDINSFKVSFKDETRKIYIGKVRYKDYEKDGYYDGYDMSKIANPSANTFFPFIHKRKIYEHEKEYRAIIPLFVENIDKNRIGIDVKVNLQTLIKRIILAPSSPEWFEELVKATLKKYDLDFPVCQSEVDKKPPEFDLSPYEPKKD